MIFLEFKDEDLRALINEIINQREIDLIEIPGIDLYMDQVTTFFDDRLNYLKRDEEDKILTKTMINNYTKAKILMPAKNKKYTKNHMVLLILIYHLKQVLSINDINMLLSPLIKSKEASEDKGMPLEELYSYFLEMKKGEEESFDKDFLEKMELINNKSFQGEADNDDYMQLLLTVLTLINQANMQKRMAEKIIDNFLKSMYQK